MGIFKLEVDMQNWLSDELESAEGLADLISNDDYVDEFEAKTIEEKKFKTSFNSCLKALYMNEIISVDENISCTKNEGLKPDFTLYAPEQEGIVIVELKNGVGPSRQAGTELSAYACEIKTYMPFLSDGDVYNVIISPEWPTLIRHYIFHEIFWNHRNIICLEPEEVLGEVRLKIVSIPTLLEVDTSMKISDQHLAGMHLCLYSKGYKKNSETGDDFDCFTPQMKAALSVMSTMGNKQNSHGFAFLWKDYSQVSLTPYMYTVVNISSLLSLERYLHGIESLADLPKMNKKLIDLVIEQDPTGHGAGLTNITEASKEFLDKICTFRYEDFTTWSSLKETMLSRGELIAFQGWGTFEEEFTERLVQEYKAGNIECDSLCPHLGLEVVSSLIDPYYKYIQAHWLIDDSDEVGDVDESEYAELL